MFWGRLLFVFCLLGLGAAKAHAEPEVKTERIPLAQALAQFGYGDLEHWGTPIKSKNDIVLTPGQASPPRVNLGRREYPFKDIAMNSRLDIMAAIPNLGSFVKKDKVEGSVLVFQIGKTGKVETQAIKFPGTYIVDVDFFGEDILRVQSMYKEEQPVQPFTGYVGYYKQYEFRNLTTGETYSLAEQLPLFNPLHIRHLSDTIYVVADLPEGKKTTEDIRYLLVHYDALTRASKVLKTLDSATGKALLGGVVDLPYRDVYRFGPEHVAVLFSLFDKEADAWQDYQLRVDTRNINAPLVTIKKEPNAKVEKSQWIEGADPSSDLFAKIGTNFPPYAYIRSFNSGVVAVYENDPRYDHYFSWPGATESQKVLSDRLIQADYKDGGFAGVNFQRNSTHVDLIRVVYDPEALENSWLSNSCESYLTTILKKP